MEGLVFQRTIKRYEVNRSGELDSGLDHGLNYGLEYGLVFELLSSYGNKPGLCRVRPGTF